MDSLRGNASALGGLVVTRWAISVLGDGLMSNELHLIAFAVDGDSALLRQLAELVRRNFGERVLWFSHGRKGAQLHPDSSCDEDGLSGYAFQRCDHSSWARSRCSFGRHWTSSRIACWSEAGSCAMVCDSCCFSTGVSGPVPKLALSSRDIILRVLFVCDNSSGVEAGW